jgi:hypothetical protein
VDPMLAAHAVTIVREFLNRARSGLATTPADQAAQRVLAVVEHLSTTDPTTRSALDRLKANPQDPQAGAELQQRVAQVVAGVPDFARDLSGAVQATVVTAPTVPPPPASVPPFSAPPVSVPPVPGPATIPMQQGVPFPPPPVPPFAPPPVPPFAPPRPPRTPEQRRRLTMMLISALTAVVVLIVGVVVVLQIVNPGPYIDISNNGWKYKVSDAHLHTAASMNGASAKPGYKYLYFTIDVKNEMGDRTAPPIAFHFARPTASLGTNCGATEGTLFDVSTYTANVVSGYCVSNDDSLLGGGTSCYDGRVPILGFHTLNAIKKGDTTTVTCVDPLLAADSFDVGSVKVYFIGSGVPSFGGSYQNVISIPTK